MENRVLNDNGRRVAGLGFRGAATTDSLRAALTTALRQLPEATTLTALSTAADKADAPAVRQLAAKWGLPLIAVPLAELISQDAVPSSAVPARYGRRSLAEAAALAGAGPGARLTVQRSVCAHGMATAAIAENTDPT